ncbi:MAG: tetratricopeptide repeat protein [Saprospiraceae bacterium]|nr:tetratricopeptide repeat protein [Saprospiraceae bacterium]
MNCLSRISVGVFLLLLCHAPSSGQDRDVPHLKEELTKDPGDSLHYELRFNLIQAYANRGDLDSAVFVARQAFADDYTNADNNRVGQINYTLAYAYDINDQLSIALDYYDRARQAYQQADNHMWIAGSINAMGTANYFAGEYGEAIRLFLESLTYAEEHDLILEQVESLINVAAVYDETDRTREAIRHCQRAAQLQQKLGTDERLGYLYIYLADYYKQLDHLDSTFYYLEQAEGIFKDDDVNPEMLGSTYTSQGSALLEKGDTALAKQKLQQGYDILKNSRANIPALLFNLTQQGSIALASGNTREAKRLLEQALNFTQDSERHEHKLDILNLLQRTHFLNGDLRKAYDHLASYADLADAVRTTDRDEMIAEMQAKYDLHQQEKQLEIQRLKIAQQASIRKLLIILAAILLVGILGLLYFLRSKNRSNALLAEQKMIIEGALQEKEILLKEIHHRVKNNLQVISSLLSLQSNSVEDGVVKEVLKEGQDRVRSMALIHQNLYQGKDLMTVNTHTYFTALIEKLVRSYSINRDTEITLDLDIDSFDLHVEKMMPLALIVNELVSNSLKHAFAEGNGDEDQISVVLQESDKDLILRVRDNGSGIADLSLFGGKSFGYKVISSFARKMKAQIDYLTDSGFGVEMRIPNYLPTT